MENSNAKIEIEVQNKTKMPDDEQFNMSFVKKVREYECLYDYTRSDYKNIQIQDKAWQEIADEFNETPTNCKERWRNLRGCYTRHLKQLITPGIRTRKPYYLAEAMNFIHPFTKTRTTATHINGIVIKADNSDSILNESDATVLNESEHNDQQITEKQTLTVAKLEEHPSYQIITKNDHHVIVTQSTPLVTAATQQNEVNLKRKLFIENDAAPASYASVTIGGSGATTSAGTYSKIQAIDAPYYEIKSAPSSSTAINNTSSSSQDTSDADMFFLKSLLPDLSLMNQSQKRRLRIQILNLIDNILNEG